MQNDTAKIFQELLDKKNLKVKDVSLGSGVSEKTLYGWLAGKTPILDWKIYNVCRFLDITIEEFSFGFKKISKRDSLPGEKSNNDGSGLLH